MGQKLDRRAILRRVFLSYPLYNACAGREGRMHFISEGKGKLGVTATRIDMVKECGAIRNPTVSAVEVFQNWRRLCRAHGLEADKAQPNKRLARLLCADVVEDTVNDYDRLKKGALDAVFRRWNDKDVPSDRVWEAMMNEDKSVYDQCYRGGFYSALDWMALFVSESGKFGLGCEGAKAGDEIWIIDGAKTPFLLRKLEGSDGSDAHRRFIGEAYLEGVMDGELAQRLEKESRNIKLV